MAESSKNFKKVVPDADFKHGSTTREFKKPAVPPFKKVAPQTRFKEVIPNGS